MTSTLAIVAASPDAVDAALVQRWRSGDRAAGSALIERHLPRLRGFLIARCGTAHDADDLAQDVFLAVCRGVQRYDPARPFTGWLYGIARKKLADAWRGRPDDGRATAVGEPIEERSPANLHAERDEAASAWREVFARLPEAQATALWLRVQEDLSVEEIAHTMEVGVSSAKVLLFRARQTLTPFFKSRRSNPC